MSLQKERSDEKAGASAIALNPITTIDGILSTYDDANRSEVKRGLKVWIKKIYHDDANARRACLVEYSALSSGDGIIADPDAREDARHVTPGLWWDMHGESMPKLMKIAMKVLSQPVSSSASERSWSTAKWIQTPSMKHETLRNRVFIHANSRLERDVALSLVQTPTWSDPESDESRASPPPYDESG